jgi:hypothetical protein
MLRQRLIALWLCGRSDLDDLRARSLDIRRPQASRYSAGAEFVAVALSLLVAVVLAG